MLAATQGGPATPPPAPAAPAVLVLPPAVARRLFCPAPSAGLPVAAAPIASPRARTRTRHRPPLPLLSLDLVQHVLAALAGGPLGGALSTDAFRRALPLALTCRAYYAAFTAAVRAVDVLPVGFATARAAGAPAPTAAAVRAAREADRAREAMGRFGAARPRARGKVSDVMVRDMVAALPKLVELQLSTAVQLTDAGVAAVAEHCPQIRTLKIAGNHAITDRAVGALRSCRSLEMLDLSFCSLLTDAAAKDLAALPALTTLSVARWNVTDAFVQDLLCGGGGGGGKALKDLNLAGCAAISDGALDHISVHAAERMEALHLRQCRRVSDAGLELLVRSCTALRELDISCNDNITADAVGLLGEMGSLRVLKASQMSNVSDAAVARLAAAGQLTSVRLSWCPLLTDAAADSLAGCRSLTEVNLSGVKLLTDAGVYALASLPALKRVKLTYCGRLSNAAVDALAGAANAPLKEVDVRSCRRIQAEKLEELRACCETLHDSTRVSQPARKIWSCRRSLPRLPNPA